MNPRVLVNQVIENPLNIKTITKDRCLFRSEDFWVQNVNYDLELVLQKGESKYYRGNVEITFDVKNVLNETEFEINPLYLDFHGEYVEDLIINGEVILDTDPQNKVFKDHRIRLSNL